MGLPQQQILQENSAERFYRKQTKKDMEARLALQGFPGRHLWPLEHISLSGSWELGSHTLNQINWSDIG